MHNCCTGLQTNSCACNFLRIGGGVISDAYADAVVFYCTDDSYGLDVYKRQILLTIAIAFGAAIIVHNADQTVPAYTQVENGLSAYELAGQYGYEGSVQDRCV